MPVWHLGSDREFAMNNHFQQVTYFASTHFTFYLIPLKFLRALSCPDKVIIF